MNYVVTITISPIRAARPGAQKRTDRGATQEGEIARVLNEIASVFKMDHTLQVDGQHLLSKQVRASTIQRALHHLVNPELACVLRLDAVRTLIGASSSQGLGTVA